MSLMLHTLKKDARRLWPAAAVTWLMLAVLAHADRWRFDWIASPMEGWMTLLLTGAWACLAALAVLEEPLAGDRHFWLTRPYRRPSLLAAKLVFVALAIHLPSFLADIFVVTAHGFPPTWYVNALLWKQILFFAAVVLPAMALAAVVRSFTHFVIALFAIAAGIAILAGGFQAMPDFRPLPSGLRHGMVRVILGLAALAVVWIQYARRRATAARFAGIAGVLAAAAVSAYLPVRAEYSLRGVHGETPGIVLRSAAGEERPLQTGLGQHTVLLPISISKGMPGARFHIPLIEVEVTATDGTRIRSVRPAPDRPFEKVDLMANAYAPSSNRPPEWLALGFSSGAWDRVKNAPVRIRGSAALDFYHPGETIVVPAQGSAGVSGVGRCTALTVEDRFSEELLKVVCESPRRLPAASITLRHEPTGRTWPLRLNSAFTFSPGPHETWLSPLHRAQSFFRLASGVPTAAGSQWLVPASYLPATRVEITPEIVTGRALAHFDFTDVALSSWLVRQ